MRCFKFVIPVGEWRSYPASPGLSASGCAAIVFATTRENAVTLLRAMIDETPSWADIATVTEIDTAVAQVALRVQM